MGELKHDVVMFGKLILFAIIFSVILNYFIIPVLKVLAYLISRLGAEGGLKHLLVVASFTTLVFTIGVFIWFGAKFLRLQ